MAPIRRKSFGGSPQKSNNFEYLRSIGEFQKTIRRRDSMKYQKSGKAPDLKAPASFLDVMNATLLNLAELSLRDDVPLGKVEILQDLDLFYIKQLAHSFKEYDLEQRIALEIKMREGTTKLLAACGAKGGPRYTQPHTLEAARALLTSNERMSAYIAELQRRRISSKRCPRQWSDPMCARVCVSDLRMPLLWKDMDHFKNKGDNRKFAVFVLLKIGTEIYDTSMLNPVNRSMTDICFDDIILLNEINPDFECKLEVYSYLLEGDHGMGSLPRKLKKTIHSSISRTVGRKLAASLREELNNADLGPKFDLVASGKLTLDNVSTDVSTHDLVLENTENVVNQLPLYGHFCCRLAAQPECFVSERISGYAKVPESDHADPSWCRIFGWKIEVWESQEDVNICPYHPIALSLDSTTEVTQTSASVLQLRNKEGLDRGVLTLVFERPEEASRWLKVVLQHISHFAKWGKAAEEEMEIFTPQPSRHNFTVPRKARFASLYEEIPLADTSSSSSEKSSYDDLCDSSSAFVTSFCTPAAPIGLRTRTFTLSSSRSSFRRWASVRGNVPFFKNKS